MKQTSREREKAIKLSVGEEKEEGHDKEMVIPQYKYPI